MESRREFCVRACQTLSAVSLAGVLPACGGSPTSPSSASALPTISGSVVNGKIVISIDAASPLSAVGSAALVLSTLGPALVAHTAQNAFTALTSICTHETCTVTGFESQTFVCPCHGSRFNTSGGVLAGPAQVPLRQFATDFSNNLLTISV